MKRKGTKLTKKRGFSKQKKSFHKKGGDCSGNNMTNYSEGFKQGGYKPNFKGGYRPKFKGGNCSYNSYQQGGYKKGGGLFSWLSKKTARVDRKIKKISRRVKNMSKTISNKAHGKKCVYRIVEGNRVQKVCPGMRPIYVPMEKEKQMMMAPVMTQQPQMVPMVTQPMA